MGPLSLGLRRVGRIQVRVTVRVTVPVTSRARLTKSGSFLALRPPLRPVAGVLLTSQAAPPALAPLAPATGRSPPPRLQSSAPRLRHRLPSSPRACGPRAAAAAHHFGSCLAFVASALISRSFVAVAAGPCASRHPPRKNFGRWGQAVLVFETVAAEPTESRCAASTFSR
jgi:hypothetical protein